MSRRRIAPAVLLAAISTLAGAAPAQPPGAADTRTIDDEVIYFVMPDRFANGDTSNDTGGIPGARLQHGFDPTHKGFYHGGDLAGLRQRLDYIAGLGATAIWITPVFVNKAVQGPPESPSAGYHGYWITDFTDIDPHLGTLEEFRALVEDARGRGIRIIMDIVINHTADVIQYRSCARYGERSDVYWSDCAYRPIAEYPYTTRGDADGAPINPGFQGDRPRFQTPENFALLVSPDWASEPFVPASEATVKRPAWLNDPLLYHNRGNSHWEGESAFYGDFSGLDDVFTEHPRVVEGMIGIYRDWIREFRIGGFRVDTAKHVNDAFWHQFNPEILDQARASGIDDFFLFGESYFHEPAELARYTNEVAFPAVLDFAFRDAAQRVTVGEAGPAALADVFAGDSNYRGDARGARILPTFIGNHDDGRIGRALLDALGTRAGDDELLERSILAHALMLFSRGVPVIYYGDEQGFTGDGRDQDAREDMFQSRVASYNDNRLIGTAATTADANFDTAHPIYRAIAGMTRVRREHAALTGGGQRVVRADEAPGWLILERSQAGERALVAFNTSDEPLSMPAVDGQWVRLGGSIELGTDGRLNAPPRSWGVFDESGRVAVDEHRN